MLDLQDPLWKTLNGGYRTPYDASARLQELEADPENATAVWEELWEELHHQGDVDIASYAAVPHIVRIYVQHDLMDWNAFAIIATIEQCRLFGKNPLLPKWLENEYHKAIQNLAAFGVQNFSEEWSHEITQGILAVIAFAKGMPNTGRMLVTFGEGEINEPYEAIFG